MVVQLVGQIAVAVAQVVVKLLAVVVVVKLRLQWYNWWSNCDCSSSSGGVQTACGDLSGGTIGDGTIGGGPMVQVLLSGIQL